MPPEMAAARGVDVSQAVVNLANFSDSVCKPCLAASDLTVENALGSDATQFSMAQSAITKSASALVVDPLDSGVGSHIESRAKSHRVAVIDYDRLTLDGTHNPQDPSRRLYAGQ